MNRQKVDTPAKVVGLWEKGVLSRGELPFLLLKALTPGTTAEFARSVTPHVRDILLDDMRRAPTTDADWEQMRVFAAGGYTGPRRQQDQDRAAIGRYRAGVELLRTVHRCLFAVRVIHADPRWHTSPVLDMARSMYDSRDFAAMPVWADALEEAGCDDPEILAHCRGEGNHVRGCWVVDLLLGKG